MPRLSLTQPHFCFFHYHVNHIGQKHKDQAQAYDGIILLGDQVFTSKAERRLELNQASALVGLEPGFMTSREQNKSSMTPRSIGSIKLYIPSEYTRYEQI